MFSSSLQFIPFEKKMLATHECSTCLQETVQGAATVADGFVSQFSMCHIPGLVGNDRKHIWVRKPQQVVGINEDSLSSFLRQLENRDKMREAQEQENNRQREAREEKLQQDFKEQLEAFKNLNENFKKVFAKDLKAVAASVVSVRQFKNFGFVTFPIKSLVNIQTRRNSHFEHLLTSFTEQVISLVEDTGIYLHEVQHIHPISRSLLEALLQIVVEEIGVVDNDFLKHIEVVEEYGFEVNDINNFDYSGDIDAAVVDVYLNISLLPKEDKNPKRKVEGTIQEMNPFVACGKQTTDCKRALAQCALQILSQAKLHDNTHREYYGILTNGLEWYIILYEDNKWRHSNLIATTKLNESGSLEVDQISLSDLAKALYIAISKSIEWCRRMHEVGLDRKSSELGGNGREGKKLADADDETDKNDGGGGGGFLGTLTKAFKISSISTSNATDKKYGKQGGSRKAAGEDALTVQNVQLLTRQNRTATYRWRYNIFT